MRDIEDHRIDGRTDTADRRPVWVLRLGDAGGEKGQQSTENGCS
jgi:hypothetical protein